MKTSQSGDSGNKSGPADADLDDADRAFNETLKRMLQTPPKPHDKRDVPDGELKQKREKPAK